MNDQGFLGQIYEYASKSKNIFEICSGAVLLILGIFGRYVLTNPYVITFLNHTDYVGKFVLLLQANSETVSSWVNVKLPTAGAPTLSTGGLWDRLEFWCDKTDLFLTNVQLGYSL